MTTQSPPPSYDSDFFAWALYQADLLKHHDINKLDFDHLAEEIESLGKSQKRELRSRLIKLMMHLLKWDYQPEMRCKSWSSTIREQRREINILLQDNPSLKNQIPEMWLDCYQDACEDALLEIGKYTVTLPYICPWNKEEIFEKDTSCTT